MTIQIVEILGRSTQGATLPFICRGEDGNTYFVKGVGAGRRSQVCEWVAGNLALGLGLPIAPFRIVDVPLELIDADPGYRDLGAGPAFGSLKQTLMELNYATVDSVPTNQQRDVLVFDWWVHNNDRMLSESGGNPNLFWEPEEEQLIVIDHNQAFDRDFSAESFHKYHVFSGVSRTLFEDALHREQYGGRFRVALSQWHNAVSGIPAEWMYVDQEQTVRSDVDLDAIFELLNRCNSEQLWESEWTG